MILDSGIATFYHKVNTAPNGAKPVFNDVEFHQGYYGELSYETNPRNPTGTREEVRVDNRIRVLQNRTITNHDRVFLDPVNGIGGYYEIQRAYHGTDDESGELISDLSLTLLDALPDDSGVPSE